MSQPRSDPNRSTAVNPTNANPTVSSVEDEVQALLRTQHPALYELLQTAPAGTEDQIDVKSLPEATQRWVWRLYAKHYPETAQWIRELDLPSWRAQFGAKLHLRGADILAAARREIPRKPRR